MDTKGPPQMGLFLLQNSPKIHKNLKKNGKGREKKLGAAGNGSISMGNRWALLLPELESSHGAAVLEHPGKVRVKIPAFPSCLCRDGGADGGEKPGSAPGTSQSHFPSRWIGAFISKNPGPGAPSRPH